MKASLHARFGKLDTSPGSVARALRFLVATISIPALVSTTVLGANEVTEKRVEDRSGPVASAPAPAGATPGRSNDSNSKPPAETPEKCEPACCVVEEVTTTVEEVQVVQTQETVIVEVPQVIAVTPPNYVRFTEVLQNTIGRPGVASVAACLDPRYPFPAYAFVGIQPQFAYRTADDTVRLQRFEVEVEARAGWHPTHSIFELAVGDAHLEVTPGSGDPGEIILATDMTSGRMYPMTFHVSRSSRSAQLGRHLLSFAFSDSVTGGGPTLRPEGPIALSIDPSPTAPLDYETPKIVLVEGAPNTGSPLLLVEKSGATASVIPAMNELQPAAYCSILHFIRQSF